MTFLQWLTRFKSWDTPRGDLADDVAGDKDFPDTDDLGQMLGYLRSRGACEGALRALKNAHRSYMKFCGKAHDA